MGAASVAVVCASAGAVVALDGGDGPDKYVAVGAAGAAPTKPGERVAPSGKVELVPLDSPTPGAPGSSGKGTSDKGAKGRAGEDAPGAGGSATPPLGDTPGESGTPSATGKPPKSTAPDDDTAGSGDSGSSGGSGGSGGGDTASSGPSAPSGPAELKLVGDPDLKKADKRWCQDVTLTLRNSGGSAVRSGTAKFETHVIGALGIDWATIDVTKKLPVPIGAGEQKRKTWTVCVDDWRVPLGMRLETKDVDVDWE
ncbi:MULTISPECIES: hypothetical protein [unclassified Streptomyces]|uniref:hypothetical protein n=1 Tax=unclassified Streptomyces TaxID=2593676 RepID=UPI00278C11EB|nr:MULTISPECIES: hypothetical protein [unclassified Streptomyces]